MKKLLARVVCILSVSLSCSYAEPVELDDIARSPLWFAHVDMTQLSAKDAASNKNVAAYGEAIQHLLKLRELAKQTLKIKSKDIHSVTIFGSSASGAETCLLLKGQLDGAHMGEMVEGFTAGKESTQQQYQLNRGFKWLGEDWYFSRLNTGEVAAANTLSALRSLLLDRHKKSSGPDIRWDFDANTKREMAEASVVVAFNMEVIHNELKLESTLCDNVKTVSLVVNQADADKATTKLILQAKDKAAIEVIAPVVHVMVGLMQAYEEDRNKHHQTSIELGTYWKRAQVEVTGNLLSIRMQGSLHQMIQSLQQLEKLLPKRRK